MLDRDALDLANIAEVVRRGGILRAGQYGLPCPLGHERTPGACHYRPGAGLFCHSCNRGWGIIGAARVLGVAGDASPLDATALATIEAERQTTMALRAEEERLAGLALADYWKHSRAAAELARHADALARLAAEGIDRLAVDQFGLGWEVYGIEGVGYPALTIPWTVGGEVRAVQYRILADDPPGGRYRWRKGSRATIFNADAVVTPQDDFIIICEGAKKSMAMWGAGIASVCAIANKAAWKPEWAPQFTKFDRVIFALDHDATLEAIEAARTVAGARVAHIPEKPDDLLARTGGDVDLLMSYIDQARRVDAGRCR